MRILFVVFSVTLGLLLSWPSGSGPVEIHWVELLLSLAR